jgi:hypothetical protein
MAGVKRDFLIMTAEDNTFRYLQGLTFAQALELYDTMYDDRKDVSRYNDYSYTLNEINEELLKYGWSVEKLQREYAFGMYGRR